MFDRFYDILDYLFPVYIIKRDQTLSIEDRRPTAITFISGSLSILFLAGAAATIALKGFTSDVGYVLGPAAGFLVSFAFGIKGTFREIYVFDKPSDTYIFTRQSIWKKD